MHNAWHIGCVSVGTFWLPETETDLYLWILKMSLTLSWVSKGRKQNIMAPYTLQLKMQLPSLFYPSLRRLLFAPLFATPLFFSLLNKIPPFVHFIHFPSWPLLATISQLSVPMLTINPLRYLCLSFVAFI